MGRFLNIAFDILCALFVLASLIYAAFRTLKQSEDPSRLLVKWLVTAGLIGLGIFAMTQVKPPYWPAVAVIFSIPIAIIWAPSVGAFVANPITSMFDGGRLEPEKKPMYSYAQAKRNKGQPKEAVAEVLKELVKFPHDLTGILLLASIHADDLKNLPAAERAIEEFIAQPELPPQTVAAALQNLADLQFRFGHGSETAIATLRRITEAYPETPLAHAALQRIAHLDTAGHVREQRAATRYSVPTGERDIGLRTGVKAPFQPPQPADEVADLVSQLEKHPADVDSRERLAVVYAEELGRVDLAADQLEQLISLRAETPRRIGHWLNLLATLHARFGNDLASAENALRRIIERFPKSAMADNALTRLASLAQEVKANQAHASVTLGSYDKQLGLKAGVNRAPANS